jgi:hypothetical protein
MADSLAASDARWATRAWSWHQLADGRIVGPDLQWSFLVTSSGMVIGDSVQFGVIHGGSGPSRQQEIIDTLNPQIFPALLALSFLHCKNVRRVENVPPPKLDKAYQKRHGRPMVRYYTLEIDPMKEILRREGRSEEVGLKKALHICRGHFADYTEKGLFGKHKGVYWFDSHVRGTSKQGIVVKDYDVKAPTH